MKVRIRKWVEGIAPGEHTGKVAVRTLRARLEQAHRDFLDWCTPSFLTTLHAEAKAEVKGS